MIFWLPYINYILCHSLQLPRHYLQFPDGFVLVYDPCEPASLDMLAGIKNDIDKNKDKKDVRIKYASRSNTKT